mmetsp:Transcript_13861/g.20747  ORF Transcript_13861/g.20747 Transcript_13861/m.20747 type:complete len:357 (-) Transcript_13861:1488-2558(-)
MSCHTSFLLFILCVFLSQSVSKDLFNVSSNVIMRNTVLSHHFGSNYSFLHHKLLLSEYSLGNCIGHYFEAYSCAMVLNIEFNMQSIPHSMLSNCTLKIISMLPTSIQVPTQRHYQESDIKKSCPCHKYCWETVQSSWFEYLESIQQILQRVLHSIPSHLCTAQDHISTVFRDQLSLKNRVTIQYRCSDILFMEGDKYGFINFHVYSDLIPLNTKYITILSEHSNRSHEGIICGNIIDALALYLETKFPFATILVQRGGDVMEAMLMLAQSPVTICSASTFCFWASLANKGIAYFPVSKLILGGNMIALRDKLRSINTTRHLWFIKEPALISFSHFPHNLSLILGSLTKKPSKITVI